MTARRRLAILVAFAAVATVLPACQSGARRGRGGAGGDPGAPESATGGAAGEISISDAELAPMDAYIRRRFWVLGDDVEIVASKEYFIQNLSIAARIGAVKREDRDGADEAVSTITYLGQPDALDFANAPRVMVGTGITVTARRRIVVRFTRTTSADVPVRLRITATGKARMGVGDQVMRREEVLSVGAQIRRGPAGYLFEES